MEDIILFGAGKRIEEVVELVSALGGFRIKEIWDNNDSLKGKKIHVGEQAIKIRVPHADICDKILITPDAYEKEIRMQLQKMGVQEESIRNWRYIFNDIKKEICIKYKNGDSYQKRIVRYLQNHELRVFNGTWYDREPTNIEVNLDKQNGLYYGVRNNKRIYLKRSLNSENLAKSYLKGIEKEQYKESPHRYYKEGYTVKDGSVLLDGGAAEGFFTLDNIEVLKYAFIVECDEEWIEALRYTFEPYKEKIEIIPKFLSDTDDEDFTSIDSLNEMRSINFIKMDIEGNEQKAMLGAKRTLMKEENVTVVACTYHCSDAARIIRGMLIEQGFDTEYSKDYMFFDAPRQIKAELRHGLVFGKKLR